MVQLQNSAKAINARDKLLMDIRRICSKKEAAACRQKLFTYDLIDFPGGRVKEEKFVLKYLEFVKLQVQNKSKSYVHIFEGDKVGVYGYRLDCNNIDLGSYRDMHVHFSEKKIEII